VHAGWRYNGDGSAAAIPQARFDGEQVERTAIASKRSCVATYPTQVQRLGLVQGLTLGCGWEGVHASGRRRLHGILCAWPRAAL